jgi:hypothetical protein
MCERAVPGTGTASADTSALVFPVCYVGVGVNMVGLQLLTLSDGM